MTTEEEKQALEVAINRIACLEGTVQLLRDDLQSVIFRITELENKT